MAKALNLVRDLPKLEKVHVYFSAFCAPPPTRRGVEYKDLFTSDYNCFAPPETIKYRTDILRTLFTALAESALPSFTSLQLSNLQDCDDEGFVTSAVFRKVLARLREFHVAVAEEDGSEVAVEFVMLSPHRHAWWRSFPETWLAPLQRDVESVTISSSSRSFNDSEEVLDSKPWGLSAKCDLRSVHFEHISKYSCLLIYPYLVISTDPFVREAHIERLDNQP
jgi:hypothetical protein